jgi:hypothetical protein
MDPFYLSDVPWGRILAAAVGLYGLALTWRGLRGEPGGERGLVRRRTSALGRAEGWRLTVFGLALAGAGAGWFWEAWWLVFLSLGIGYVEVQEATGVINAWRWNGGRGTSDARPATTAGTRRGRTDKKDQPSTG